MFATKLHTQVTTAKASALCSWCAQGELRQDSTTYLVKPASIRFANPEAGT